MDTLLFVVIISILGLATLIKKIKEASGPPTTHRTPRKLYSATSDDVARFFQGIKGKQAAGRGTPAVKPKVEIVEITEADIAEAPGRRAPGRRPGFREEKPAMDVEVIDAEDIIEEATADLGMSAEALGLKGPQRAAEGAHLIRDAEDIIDVTARKVAPKAHVSRKSERAAARVKRPAKKSASEIEQQRRVLMMLTEDQKRQAKMRRMMARLFDSTGDFRRGMIMLEVLGRPKALREDF